MILALVAALSLVAAPAASAQSPLPGQIQFERPDWLPRDLGQSARCLVAFAVWIPTYTIENGEPPRLTGPPFPVCGIGLKL